MLKLFTAILSIYILVLTAIPCCAYEHCEENTVEREDNSKHHDQEKKEGCGTCSPFFCHTCSGFIITTYSFLPGYTPVVQEREYNLYLGSFYPDYIPYCWEPPDIV